MSSRNLLVSLLLLSMSAQAELGHHLVPALGKPAPEGFESVVMPDGSGLPAGSGTVSEGERIFWARCSACHGTDGKQAGNELTGGQGTLATPRPLRTVGSFWPYATTLFDYVARAMPYGEEKSLSHDEIYSVVAYLLHLNDIIGEDAALDRESLPEIVMPNRDGFFRASEFSSE